MQVSTKLDTREFDRAFKEYMKYTKRSLSEAVNQHAYYTARDATFTTKAVSKEHIGKELSAPSKNNPDAPLAAILVNMNLAAQGKPGLTGTKMAKAVEKFIRKRQASRNFLRAGWIPAIKVLEKMVPKRGGQKIPQGVKIKGQSKGGARGDNGSTWRAIASIWNSVQGSKGKPNTNVKEFIEQGAQEALNMEAASMWKYIERKANEAIRKHNMQP